MKLEMIINIFFFIINLQDHVSYFIQCFLFLQAVLSDIPSTRTLQTCLPILAIL